MIPQPSFEAYLQQRDSVLARYVPPRSAWEPDDEALYCAPDLFRVPLDEAEKYQMRAMQHAFQRHYAHNVMYHAFCLEHGVSPADIKAPEDLARIPLIPDRFFKEYPQGRDFAGWLGNITTGKLPPVAIKGQQPSFEEVVRAFNVAGMVVSYSSGTGGRHTVIPRDQRTYDRSEYALAASVITMIYPGWDKGMSGYLLLPDPHKTNVFAGKVTGVYYDVIKEVRTAIDRDIPADMVRASMSGGGGLRMRLMGYAMRLGTVRMVAKIVAWLEERHRRGDRIVLVGAPFLVALVMDKLEEQGKRLDFSGRGGVVTGGGWKFYERRRLSVSDFRRRAGEILGIDDRYCLDVYGMVEGNGWMVHCPEGHYLHVPYTYYKPLVLGPDYRPVGYGEWGRFAFLDALATSYPGFIITGDMVRLLEHCPVCGRPGPVLEPEIRRASGEDVRGCGEEVRRMVSGNLGGTQ